LNAAAALATDNGDLTASLSEAQTALDNGAAVGKLDQLIQHSQAFA